LERDFYRLCMSVQQNVVVCTFVSSTEIHGTFNIIEEIKYFLSIMYFIY
jgi:hypothetical protein